MFLRVVHSSIDPAKIDDVLALTARSSPTWTLPRRPRPGSWCGRSDPTAPPGRPGKSVHPPLLYSRV